MRVGDRETEQKSRIESNRNRQRRFRQNQRNPIYGNYFYSIEISQLKADGDSPQVIITV